MEKFIPYEKPYDNYLPITFPHLILYTKSSLLTDNKEAFHCYDTLAKFFC